jgi:predicted acylesterase/phospholipase RssA
MTDAIILGGGGSKGAFAVGVLLRLYELGIRPGIIFGASAGALNALKLAEAPRDPLQAHRIQGIWRNASSADFFATRPWMNQLLGRFAKVSPDLPGGFSPSQVFDLATALFVSPAFDASNLLQLVRLGLRLKAVRDALRTGLRDESIFCLSPIASLLRAVVDESAVRASPAELFLAVTHYRTGELRFVNKHGVIHDRELNPLLDMPPVSLIDAAVASSSLPAIFRPTMLAGEPYVDGSVRGNIPVRTAIRRGAKRIFAVLLTPAPLAALPPGMPALSDIVLRVPDMMLDEILYQELQTPGAEVQIIAPLQDMHSSLEVDSGLIAIDIDYGYLRAADRLSGASNEIVAITEKLFRLRYQSWRAEIAAAGPENRNVERAMQVRQLKRQIAAAAISRRDCGGVMPADFEDWWQNWEVHGWQPAYASPWAAHTFADGSVLAPEEPPKSCCIEAVSPPAKQRVLPHPTHTAKNVWDRYDLPIVPRLSSLGRNILSWLSPFPLRRSRLDDLRLSPTRVTYVSRKR